MDMALGEAVGTETLEESPNDGDRRKLGYIVFDAFTRTHPVKVRRLSVDYKAACAALHMSIKNPRNIIGNNLVTQTLVTMKHPETGDLLHYTPAHVTIESQKEAAKNQNMSVDTIKRIFGKSRLDSTWGFDHGEIVHGRFHKFATLMNVYFLRILYVPIVEAVALNKTVTYWKKELEVPMSTFSSEGVTALSLKAGRMFDFMEHAWANQESGGSGLLDPEASSHPLWGVTVTRTASFLRILGTSRLIFYATPTETKVLRPLVRVLLMAVEELSDVIYFDRSGTCSTANILVSLAGEIDALIKSGGSLYEDMNEIVQEAIHAFFKEGLTHQAFGGMSGAAGALVEVFARLWATFRVTEDTKSLNCAKAHQHAQRRRQNRLNKWFASSNNNIPVPGRRKPSDRPEPRGHWKGTESWLGGDVSLDEEKGAQLILISV